MPFWVQAVAVRGTGKWPPGASGPERGAAAAARKPIARVRCTADRESLYSVLGLAPGASEKEIKGAYRRLALKLHPDVNKAPGAEERFIRVKQAYQILMNPSTRRAYDSSKRPGRRGKQEEEFYGLDDFVRDLQAEWDKRRSSSSKSLWEELGDIGEEFLEFLEKELGGGAEGPGSPEAAQQQQSGSDDPKVESDAKKLEDEIEEMLSRLKDELGM